MCKTDALYCDGEEHELHNTVVWLNVWNLINLLAECRCIRSAVNIPSENTTHYGAEREGIVTGTERFSQRHGHF